MGTLPGTEAASTIPIMVGALVGVMVGVMGASLVVSDFLLGVADTAAAGVEVGIVPIGTRIGMHRIDGTLALTRGAP